MRAPGESRAVTPLELFFDLVYVFAISQLTHLLVAQFDLRGAIETLILALAVVYAWYMTAWLSNWLSPDIGRSRLLLLAIMLASLLMSSAIGEAFAGSRLALRHPATWRSRSAGRPSRPSRSRPGTNQRIHFVNLLGWEIAVAPLWIAGALADGDARIAIWAAAVVVLHVGVVFYHPVPGRPSHLRAPIGPDAAGVHSDVAGEHLLERLPPLLPDRARRDADHHRDRIRRRAPGIRARPLRSSNALPRPVSLSGTATSSVPRASACE